MAAPISATNDGGVDDRALALPPHVRDRVLAAQVDAGQVDLLDPLPGVQAGVQDRVVVGRGDAGVVERDVDPAVAGRPPRRTGAATAASSAHVARRRTRRRPLGGGLLPAAVVDVDRDHPGALGGEPPRGGQPDPAARPGDDRDPSVQSTTARSSLLRSDEDVLGLGERVRARPGPARGRGRTA